MSMDHLDKCKLLIERDLTAMTWNKPNDQVRDQIEEIKIERPFSRMKNERTCMIVCLSRNENISLLGQDWVKWPYDSTVNDNCGQYLEMIWSCELADSSQSIISLQFLEDFRTKSEAWIEAWQCHFYSQHLQERGIFTTQGTNIGLG